MLKCYVRVHTGEVRAMFATFVSLAMTNHIRNFQEKSTDSLVFPHKANLMQSGALGPEDVHVTFSCYLERVMCRLLYFSASVFNVHLNILLNFSH